MSDQVQLLVDAAVQAAESHDFLTASGKFAEALKLQPEAAALHEQHAQCLMELEQHEAALAAAQAAIHLMPEWPAAWTTCARCHLNLGQLQDAQKAFSQSLMLDPTQLDVQDELSEAQLLAQQQLSIQVGLLGLAIKTSPGGQVGPGSVVWEAGVQLAHFLVGTCQAKINNLSQPLPTAAADHPAASCTSCCSRSPCLPVAVPGSLLLEVGAGTGVVGITAAALGAQVTLTDLPELQQLLQANIAANEQLISTAQGSAAAAVLDWTALECPQHCSSALLQQRWDFGMGADLVFNTGQVAAVVQLIATLVRPKAMQEQPSGVGAGRATTAAPAAAAFLLAHKHRHQQVDDCLLDALAAAGLTVSALQVQQQQSHHCVDSQMGCGHQQRRAGGYQQIVNHEQPQLQALPPDMPAEGQQACCHAAVSLWWITADAATPVQAAGSRRGLT